MMIQNLVVAASVAALLAMSGCSYLYTYREVTNRSDLSPRVEQQPLVVITRDGSEYRLDRYTLRDSTLEFAGLLQKGEDVVYDGQIPLDSIDYLYLKEGNFFKSVVFAGLVGSTVGLVATAFQTTNGLEATDHITYPQTRSCPFVYAFDGSRFVLSSETFAGSIYKGAERRVIDRLEHIEPSNGEYLIKLMNERLETDYVNELTLSAVDVQDDVQVLASADGVFHTVTSLLPPVKCVDGNAGSVLEVVREPDGLLWESQKHVGSEGDSEEFTDRLEAEFQLKSNSGSVKLLMRGQNTLLPSFTFNRLSELCGSGYAQWIRRLEHDPAKGNQMRGFLLREGLLHVSVWDGTEWQKAGVFMDSGEELLKEQILVVPVPSPGARVLRVRLECTADLWRIDQIGVDESIDMPVKCVTVRAATATGSRGADCTPLVANRDDSYLTSLMGDTVLLSYPVPSLANGMHRTVFVQAAGYYHHWSSLDGPDNSAEVDNVLAIPGYGARTYLPLWFSQKH